MFLIYLMPSLRRSEICLIDCSCIGYSKQALQSWLYYLVSTMTDNISELGTYILWLDACSFYIWSMLTWQARFTGILRGQESFAQAVSFGINTRNWKGGRVPLAVNTILLGRSSILHSSNSWIVFTLSANMARNRGFTNLDRGEEPYPDWVWQGRCCRRGAGSTAKRWGTGNWYWQKGICCWGEGCRCLMHVYINSNCITINWELFQQRIKWSSGLQ